MPNSTPSQSAVTPPWLAKLNSVNEQAEKAISNVQSAPAQSTQSNPLQAPAQFEFQNQLGNPPLDKVELNHTFGKLGPDSFLYERVIAESVTKSAQAALSNVVNQIQLSIDSNGVVSVPADLPPGQYIASIGPEPMCDGPDLGKFEGPGQGVGNLSQFQFDAESFAQAIGKGSRVESDTVASHMDAEYSYNPDHMDKLVPLAVDPLLSDAEIPTIGSWKPVVEVELPVVLEPVTLVEYVSPDTNQPRVSEEEYYAAIVSQLAQSNPTEAQLIARLRLFQSQYVGLITCPEQAIDHIAQSRRDSVPIGGSDAVELSAQSTSLKHKQYIEKRYASHKVKRGIVEAARADWKKAIADRNASLAQWDEFVKWHHDNYKRLKAMEPDAFVTKEVK